MRNNFTGLMAKKYGAGWWREMTYYEISVKSKVPAMVLWRWNKGYVSRFDAKTVEALCKFFGCAVGELLELE